jgi:hypothetical protein
MKNGKKERKLKARTVKNGADITFSDWGETSRGDHHMQMILLQKNWVELHILTKGIMAQHQWTGQKHSPD